MPPHPVPALPSTAVSGPTTARSSRTTSCSAWDSAEEELSEDAELALIRFWMEHEPGQSSRIERWYDLSGEFFEVEQQLKRCAEARTASDRIAATALEGRLQQIGETLAWLEEGMTAILEGQPLPAEPDCGETVKIADLFGAVVDTHLSEAQLRNPLPAPRRRS